MCIFVAYTVECDSEEMTDFAIERCLDVFSKFRFEGLFNFVGCAEVNEIIDVEAYIQWGMSFDDCTGEDTV